MQLITEEKTKLKQRELLISPEVLLNCSDPLRAIQSGKTMARAWIRSIKEEQATYGQSFMLKVMETYWEQSHSDGARRPLPFLFQNINIIDLDNAVVGVAVAIGSAASKLSVVKASYLLGNIYTAILPESIRTSGGVYYTPPALTERLILNAEKAGVDWATAKVIDPACGGGAFLAPVCFRILKALQNESPEFLIKHIESHLTGWEIDPFGGWLTQLFVEVSLKHQLRILNRKLNPLVKIVDSLYSKSTSVEGSFDLVIGNPPYGKIKLTETIKSSYKESLYGHPNLYGLFTQLSLDLARENGVVALLTPTSFLAGEYFKNLRKYIRLSSTPVEIDFVSIRKGVFEDVLQETMLAIYRKTIHPTVAETTRVRTNELLNTSTDVKVRSCGNVTLASELTAPWILPRNPTQTKLIRAMAEMPDRLADWGYSISTGPLVWNRHKLQLSNSDGPDKYPVVWAEAITHDGRFILKAEKKNHKAFFKFQEGQEWLITRESCILLQRTTSKEQMKRLIAASLPVDLVKNGVVVENHLNIILPDQKSKGLVATSVLAAILNSKIVNEVFRTISGSVAVSAYELEALPLPSLENIKSIDKLINQGATNEEIEHAVEALYSYRK